MLEFRCVASSHVGLVRAHNEDSAVLGPRLALVADGMGGAAAGDLASAIAARTADELARARAGALAPRELLDAVVAEAADRIRGLVRAEPERSGMGTTFTALATDGARVVLAHLGDSRAYLWRRGSLTQLSVDHTLVQALVAEGRLSPAQARRSAHRHIVMRSLGGGGTSEPDLVDLDLVAGDRVLVCSDGLSDLVADADLALLLAVPDARSGVDLMVAAALDAGGSDNVTCLVLDVLDGTGSSAGASTVDGGTLLGAAAVTDASGPLDAWPGTA